MENSWISTIRAFASISHTQNVIYQRPLTFSVRFSGSQRSFIGWLMLPGRSFSLISLWFQNKYDWNTYFCLFPISRHIIKALKAWIWSIKSTYSAQYVPGRLRFWPCKLMHTWTPVQHLSKRATSSFSTAISGKGDLPEFASTCNKFV